MSNADCTVEYREIPDYPSYRIGNDGSILSNKFGRWSRLQPVISGNYYPSISLCDNGSKRKFSIHRLVLEAFVGICPEGMQACHNNGNRLDFRLVNLRWDTPSNNNKDKEAHGTWQCGSRHGLSKITDEDVIAIRHRANAKKETLSEIASCYSIAVATVSKIARGQAWKHIGGPFTRKITLTENAVREIRNMLVNHVSPKDIAKKYRIDLSTVSNIKTRKTWSHIY